MAPKKSASSVKAPMHAPPHAAIEISSVHVYVRRSSTQDCIDDYVELVNSSSAIYNADANIILFGYFQQSNFSDQWHLVTDVMPKCI